MPGPARRPLVAGNWKMNLNHLEAIALVQKVAFDLRERETDKVEVVVLPPFTAIRSVQTVIEGDRFPIGYGAQDLSPHDEGAYTGDISGTMLAKLGCRYVVVGHSERRQHHGESDALVAAKVRAAYRHDLTPILCVGEDEQVRAAGDHIEHVLTSLDGSLDGVAAEQALDRNHALVVAYEPVWAIGTGKTATEQDAQEMCAAIRERLVDRFGGAAGEAVRVLYGGSVKPGNAALQMEQPDVDGVLVGGASLVAEDFTAIVRGAVPADAQPGRR